ncbi:hypothetical protein [Arenimonas sp.]|uniref:hypothetical protein n=1 Tax=Arenimonas sp. TaxID=1872635 RepID=UPI0035AF04AF
MAILSVLLLMAGMLLGVFALAVRFAGDNAILSGIRQGDVSDMAALNRWAGNRLLVLPVVALAFGAAGLREPLYGVAGLFVLLVAGFGIIGWLMLGTERFRVSR